MAASDKPNMTRRNFFLPDPIFDALQTKANKTGTTMSEHLRAALIAYLKLDEQDHATAE